MNSSLELTRAQPSFLAYAFAKLAPRPKRLADTGLSRSFVSELAVKHLFDAGVLSVSELSRKLALSGGIVEDIVLFMRQEAMVEVLGAGGHDLGLRHRLTDRGRVVAQDAFARSGYLGPAPIPLTDYQTLVAAQSVHDQRITRPGMSAAFADIVISDEIVDQLGPALNSGRAIFVYGAAGSGKTYITHRLTRLFQGEVLLPHAVITGSAVIPIFDPVFHRVCDDEEAQGILLEEGHDPRLLRVERPVVISGGELTIDMLQLQFDPHARNYKPPLQLLANNGIFIIDDMGRQRAAPMEVFNRWIIPMEAHKDYLNLGGGRHITVPFDVVLVFTTNIHPLELADDAFLRRIGYKVEFRPLNREQYGAIWRNECTTRGIPADETMLEFAIDELHRPNGVPLLACHPRDLLSIAVDRADYLQEPKQLSEQALRWAWKTYFVSPGGRNGTPVPNSRERGERQ